MTITHSIVHSLRGPLNVYTYVISDVFIGNMLCCFREPGANMGLGPSVSTMDLT